MFIIPDLLFRIILFLVPALRVLPQPHFNIVNIKLNGLKKHFIIEALLEIAICSPIVNQNITLVAQKYPYLRNLKLADLLMLN